jgi:hypothetical protein
MFISLSKAQRVNNVSCLIVTGLDGRTADAVHQRR